MATLPRAKQAPKEKESTKRGDADGEEEDDFDVAERAEMDRLYADTSSDESSDKDDDVKQPVDKDAGAQSGAASGLSIQLKSVIRPKVKLPKSSRSATSRASTCCSSQSGRTR